MAAVVLALSALPAAGPVPQAAPEEYPRPDEFAKRIREGLRRDEQIQKQFTYLERRRDVKISRLGKVAIGPLRTFEVFPSDEPGGTYKRLIAVDGKPLGPEELARRDAQHQRDLERAAERERRETPAERAERLRAQQEEWDHRRAMVNDVMAIYEPRFEARETIEGQRVLVTGLEPRRQARPSTREGRWMQHFRGTVWVDEGNDQVVRLDMRAFEDVTIGWGIIGRIHEGSRVFYQRRRVEDVWLPAELTYEASGRTLLFRTFSFKVTTTFSDYKRVAAVTNP